MKPNIQQQEEMYEDRPIDKKGLFTFLFPSLFGVFVFLFPIMGGQAFNIPLGIMSEYLIELLQNYLAEIVTTVMVISMVLTLFTVTIKPKFATKNSEWRSLFDVSIFWTLTRVFGALFALMTLFGIGIQAVYSSGTGQVMLNDLLSTLIVWFFVASFLMPYLINFGAMEFIGTLLRSITKPLFTLPGRSAVDLLASWIGNVNVGVVITREQYETGFYTSREAATIATCFSTVSLPFCLVIAGMLQVDHVFPVFYLTIVLAGLASAIIIPRIPPLSKMEDTYYTESTIHEDLPEGKSRLRWAVEQAVGRAKQAGSFRDQLKQSTQIFMNIIFVLLPQAMAIGTVALIIAEFTPFFDIISKPMIPLLQLLQIPSAAAAAPATIVGFIDMFIPAVLASGIEEEMTRFFVGALSLVQIIYLTEMGTLLIVSKIPINIGRLFIVFMQRTLISIPIIAVMAHLLY